MNYTKKSYKIGLIDNNFAWETLLNQEGNFYKTITAYDDFNDYNAIIVTSFSNINKEKLYSYIKNGGLALCESKKFAQITNEKIYKKKVKFLISEKDSYFSQIGLIDVDNYIYSVFWENILDLNLKISYRQTGKGTILLIPFDFAEVFSNHRFSRKKFYANRFELPSEDVSNVSKYKFLKLVSISLQFLFDKIELPYVTKWFYPADFKSVFIFRIDTDFCSLNDAKELFELTKKYDMDTTWFVDTSSEKNLKELYSKLPSNHEVGLHAYRHLVYKDFTKNQENIKKGLDILRKFGIFPQGFAAPFGEWNITLQKAIDENFIYSSDFAYDYDNFPSYPFVAGKFSQSLQIPVHPISIGRLIRSHFTLEEMVEYYKYVIDYLISQNLPVIIYHHPHHRYFEVLEEIFKFISQDKNIKKMTMHSFYKIWKDRIESDYEISLENGVIKGFKGYIRVISKGKSALINKDVKISDIKFEEIHKFTVPNDIKRIRKPHWRDILYDYEKKRSKARL